MNSAKPRKHLRLATAAVLLVGVCLNSAAGSAAAETGAGARLTFDGSAGAGRVALGDGSSIPIWGGAVFSDASAFQVAAIIEDAPEPDAGVIVWNDPVLHDVYAMPAFAFPSGDSIELPAGNYFVYLYGQGAPESVQIDLGDTLGDRHVAGTIPFASTTAKVDDDLPSDGRVFSGGETLVLDDDGMHVSLLVQGFESPGVAHHQTYCLFNGPPPSTPLPYAPPCPRANDGDPQFQIVVGGGATPGFEGPGVPTISWMDRDAGTFSSGLTSVSAHPFRSLNYWESAFAFVSSG